MIPTITKVIYLCNLRKDELHRAYPHLAFPSPSFIENKVNDRWTLAKSITATQINEHIVIINNEASQYRCKYTKTIVNASYHAAVLDDPCTTEAPYREAWYEVGWKRQKVYELRYIPMEATSCYVSHSTQPQLRGALNFKPCSRLHPTRLKAPLSR